MKFIDELVIEVESGKGGDGMVAFRREKFVPYGGPSGGDGGKGGDVIIMATTGLNTLYELSFRRIQAAPPGVKGLAKDMAGANGKDLIIKVPVGTLVYDRDTDELLADLDADGKKFIPAAGGRGGKGNAKFANSVRRAPRMAEKGEPGQKRILRLELKLLADVGLIGLPNAGKSTLLSVVSNAHPKIADYPFTTLVPHLGIIKLEGLPSFCMADLPGLIEGAHSGAGLGIQFLKHIERTRLLLHLVDLSAGSVKECIKGFDTILGEVEAFNPSLMEKPMIVAANKLDLPEAQEHFPEFKKKLKKRGFDVLGISGASKEGLKALLKKLVQVLSKTSAPEIKPVQTMKTYTYLPPFEIEKSGRQWMVQGSEIERLTKMTDFTSDDGIALFKTKLKKMGFIDALARCKGKDDDTVSIGPKEFFYWEFFR